MNRRRAAAWPFADLEPGAYDLIVVDPPWRFEVRSAAGRGRTPEDHYKTMTVGEIAALPVGALAARNTACVLWTTWPHLVAANAVRVLSAWGFKPKTGGTWYKTCKNGKGHLGLGYILREVSEPFVIATRGAPRFTGKARGKIEAGADLSFDGLARREHSRKPEEFFRFIHEALREIRRPCELFARQRRRGWDSWGDELDKFGEGP